MITERSGGTRPAGRIRGDAARVRPGLRRRDVGRRDGLLLPPREPARIVPFQRCRHAVAAAVRLDRIGHGRLERLGHHHATGSDPRVEPLEQRSRIAAQARPQMEEGQLPPGQIRRRGVRVTLEEAHTVAEQAEARQAVA